MHVMKSHFCVLVTATLRRGRDEIRLMEIKAGNSTKIFWIIISLIAVWLLFIRPEVNIRNLRNNGQETKGIIYSKKGVGSKGTIRCFYRFEINGRTYEGFYDNEKLNQWDSLEIIYYISDPSLNQAKQFVDDY